MIFKKLYVLFRSFIFAGLSLLKYLLYKTYENPKIQLYSVNLVPFVRFVGFLRMVVTGGGGSQSKTQMPRWSCSLKIATQNVIKKIRRSNTAP